MVSFAGEVLRFWPGISHKHHPGGGLQHIRQADCQRWVTFSVFLSEIWMVWMKNNHYTLIHPIFGFPWKASSVNTFQAVWKTISMIWCKVSAEPEAWLPSSMSEHIMVQRDWWNWHVQIKQHQCPSDTVFFPSSLYLILPTVMVSFCTTYKVSVKLNWTTFIWSMKSLKGVYPFQVKRLQRWLKGKEMKRRDEL